MSTSDVEGGGLLYPRVENMNWLLIIAGDRGHSLVSKVCSASVGSHCIHMSTSRLEGGGSLCPRAGNTNWLLKVLLSSSVTFLTASSFSSSLTCSMDEERMSLVGGDDKL